MKKNLRPSSGRSTFHPVVLGMLLVFGLSSMMIMAATLPGTNLDNTSEAKMMRGKTVRQETPANTDNIMCMDLYEPVCGKDGKTYSNGCYALRAGTEVASEGECATGNTNTRRDTPVMMKY